MKFLFFDTETTGLPKDFNAPYTDIDKWPRLVQIAWIVFNDREIVSKHNYIIRPIGFSIPKYISDIHGISTEMAMEQGCKVDEVIKLFLHDCHYCNALIGHNISFDLNVVQSEMHRLNLGNLKLYNTFDTMKASINYTKIPNDKHGYRYPKLIELYSKLFSETFDNMHNAMADIEATAKCFWALIDRKIINREDYTFLLTKSEKVSLADSYNKEAHAIRSHGKSDDKRINELYLKSAKLGNLDSMYQIACRFYLDTYNPNKDGALNWYREFIKLSELKDKRYEDSLKKIISINKSKGFGTSRYEKLLEEYYDQQKNQIILNQSNSEADYVLYVMSVYSGKNGFDKDVNLAARLIEQGVEKGFRSLYWLYSLQLKDNGDERYFYYLLQSIADEEKECFKKIPLSMRSGAKRQLGSSNKCLLDVKYRLVAEAYTTGFGVKQDIEKAIEYLKEVFKYYNDTKAIHLYARIHNGEFGKQYINFNESIKMLNKLKPDNSKDYYSYALLGDAYFGKSWFYYFKSLAAYNKYPEIREYNSTQRKRFHLFSIVISLLALMGLIIIVIACALKK